MDLIASGSNMVLGYEYQFDGVAWVKRWPYSLTSAYTQYSEFFEQAAVGNANQSNSGLETVYRFYDKAGATYEYYYDAQNRRRIKEYPTGVRDELFYGMGGKEMIIDRGSDSVASSSYYPIDEYLWLGGRPVLAIRGRLETDYSRAADGTTTCGRNGATEKCGMYFPVTDELGRVVLMLDDSRKVAGVGEYDVYGSVNTVTISAETAHPYAHNTNQTLVSMAQPRAAVDGGTNLDLKMRAHVFWMWTENGPTSADQDPMQLVNATTDAGLTPGYAGLNAPFWTSWVSLDAGTTVEARFMSGAASCCQDQDTGWTCGGSCTCQPNCNNVGVTLDSWEYRKAQVGAAQYWVPMRLPGQYYDEESGVFENWNRFYGPDLGRYLQPEPLLQEPDFQVTSAFEGRVSPAYGYAYGNPLTFVDPNGLQGTCAGMRCATTATGEIVEPLVPSVETIEAVQDVVNVCLAVAEAARNRRNYTCTTTCQANGAPTGAYYVTGTGRTCSAATRAAKASVPRGQYPRHCSCRDSNGWHGTGTQCE